MDAQPLIQARDLQHSFGATPALRGLDFTVYTGEMVAVMGPSGSGKSTLLHMLAGVLTPDRGTVSYRGRTISTLSEAERSTLRLTDFGFVFQFGQLLPDLTAVDNVTIPLLLAKIPRREATRRATEWLDRLGLADHREHRPSQLSGGQAQRVAMARAMVTRPTVIFADEPTGSLDSLAGEQTMALLTRTVRDTGTTVILVTHDPRTAGYAHREVVVRDGRITVSAGDAVV